MHKMDLQSDMDNEQPTAEWVFQANAKVRDYHKNVDSFMFMKCYTKRLLPSFKSQYPEKKMILILDNAPYHHSHPAGGLNLRTMTKTRIIVELAKRDVQHVPVKRGNVTVPMVPGDFGNNAPKGPYVHELMDALHSHLKATDKTALMTELHIAMDKQCWMLIFTPPYRPQFQPIELVWRHGKGYAASQWTAGRSLKETYYDLCAGWYGGTSRNGAVFPSAITSQQAQSWIKTAEDFMDDYGVAGAGWESRRSPSEC